MDRIAALWFCIGVASLGFIFQGELGYLLSNNSLMQAEEKPQIAEAIYAVPPTPAFKVFILNDTLDTQGDTVNASSYDQIAHIITDGTIELNRGIGGLP